MSENSKTEFEAFQQVHKALVDLDSEAQSRIISSVSTLLGLSAPSVSQSKGSAMIGTDGSSLANETDNQPPSLVYSEFAELYAAASPNAGPTRLSSLVIGFRFARKRTALLVFRLIQLSITWGISSLM